MKAYYFRQLFQNTRRGTVHTLSTDGGEGAFCLYYLCSDGRPVREKEDQEKRFCIRGKNISVLVLEHLHPTDLEQAGELLKHNHVEKVFLPYGDTAETLPELSQAEKVYVLEKGQTVSFQEKGWDVWVKCLDGGSKGNLVLYHGPSQAVRQGEDCLMAVKPFDKTLPCQVCMDAEDHSCGMRCCLYNDFTLCKGHNRKDIPDYVAGTLLLGNGDPALVGEDLNRELKEYIPYIRTVALASGKPEESSMNAMMELISQKNKDLNQYFVMPEDAEQNEKILKTIMKKGLRRIPVLTGADSGLCISGFIKDKPA